MACKKWGIDPKAKTPAYTHEDGQDYVPSSKFTVFSHQFSSIAGAGPVTGPILASVFGWVPVLLWLIIGGLFFGAVQDFGALYASVKNEGKSMGMIIEKYIGKTGRKLFMLFCWLFTLLVIAAFTDMVAGTFNGVGLDSAETAYANSAADFHFHAVYRGSCYLRCDSETCWKNERVGQSGRCNRSFGCNVCSWYETSNLCFKDSMDLHHHGILIPCIRTSDVAFNAT